MAKANLNRSMEVLNDPAVIVQIVSALPGGVTLDLSDWTEDFVRAGHVIIRDAESKEYKPLKVQSNKYEAVGESAEVVGILMTSVSKRDPQASILTAGQINCGLAPYMPKKEVKTALPRIDFLYFNNEE